MRELLDKKDIQILRIIQRNSKITTREIARQLDIPVTTVFTRIKKLEQKGIIKEYRAILNEKKLGKSTTCLLYTSPSPRDLSTSRMPSSA